MFQVGDKVKVNAPNTMFHGLRSVIKSIDLHQEHQIIRVLGCLVWWGTEHIELINRPPATNDDQES